MVAQDVTVDQTWTAAGSPYVIANTSDFSIRAKLILEPCAEVLIGPGIDVTLRDAGSIEGIGTATQPIHIGATTPGQPFQRIYTGAGSIKLAYTTIDGGGYSNSPTSTAASMIAAQGDGDDPVPQPLLDFDHVTVKGSATQGITLRSRASFSANSQTLTVTGSHYLPLRLSASSVSTVPTGSYVGNGKDAIGLDTTVYVDADATVHDRGIPYLVGGDGLNSELRVEASTGLATLTIEPGVTMRFDSMGWLTLQTGSGTTAAGALVAVGTAAKPIVFTSDAASPAPGDWQGIYFWGNADPRDRIDHARVEYAGARSAIQGRGCFSNGLESTVRNYAAIRFLGPGSPGSEIVTNTTITQSPTNGIDCGWTGAPIDFLTSNTFVGIATCFTTYPEPTPPDSCPAKPPCPH